MGLFDKTLKNYGYERQEQKSGTQPAVQEKDYTTASGALGQIVGAGARTPGFSSFNGEKQQLQAYRDWVYIAAKAVAEQCAGVDLRLFANHTKANNLMLGQKLIENPRQVAEYFDKKVNYYETKSGILQYRKNVSALEELDVHPLLTLMNQPNTFMGKNEFLEITFLHLKLTGNAYWFIARNKKGTPTELWPLMPQQMAIVPDETHFVIGYVYTNNGKQIPLDPEDVIHHKYGNPMDLRHGYSGVAAGATTIDADTHAGIFNDNFFRNSAMPDGFLTTEESLDEKTFKRLKTEWMNNYSGPSNAHRTAILSGGLQYKNLQIPQRDMEFLKGRNFNRDMIFALFGIPKSLLGFDESMSKANAQVVDVAFARRVLRIELQRLTNRITMSLAPQFDKNLIMSFTDPVPADKAQVLADNQASLGGTNTIGFNTINEVRAKRGDLPIPGGDDVFIPMNMQPLGKANFELTPEGKPADATEEEDENKPEENDDTTNDNKEPNAPAPTSSAPSSGISDGGSTTSDTTNSNRAVEVPKQKMMSAFPENTKLEPLSLPDFPENSVPKTLPDFPKSIISVSGGEEDLFLAKAAEAAPDETPAPTGELVDPSKMDSFVSQAHHMRDMFQTHFMPVCKAHFDQQKSEVLYNVQARYLSGAKSVEGLIKKDAKKKLDNLFDKTQSAASWSVGLLPIYKGATVSSGKLAAQVVNDPEAFGFASVAPDTPVDYSSVSAQVDKYFAEHEGTIAKGIDEETDKQLRAILSTEISKGTPLQGLLDAVESVYASGQNYRSLRIAVTESHQALSYASQAIWKSSGQVQDYRWSADGPNPCPICLSLNGTVHEDPSDFPEEHVNGCCDILPNSMKPLTLE